MSREGMGVWGILGVLSVYPAHSLSRRHDTGDQEDR